ncbi:Clp protease N-terminal domain-containing protein [Lipingzhangella sp. LS1_29]|uniref:Clp protease N-terminal domain-containing protein n=1 Tax=Lipingzhangella rawalii TaxID=2055835 RepID=A0ABU2H340_9ACTN|nr:Clp protease N-terminal domain-containing protein [Lipingzhangella rawalii]MDS1269265.1 Clp protease N-terminal domain-containing protein [Lipingzhangella rawalii]
MSEDEWLPMTPRCASIIKYAGEISRSKGSGFIGVEHLFIAILKDESSVPCQISKNEIGDSEVERLIAALLEFVSADEYTNTIDKDLLRRLGFDSGG